MNDQMNSNSNTCGIKDNKKKKSKWLYMEEQHEIKYLNTQVGNLDRIKGKNSKVFKRNVRKLLLGKGSEDAI